MLKWKEKDIETRCLVETEHEVSVRKAPRSFDRNQNKIGLCQVLKLPENFKLSEKRGESTRTKSDSNGSFISRQQLHFVLCDFFSFSFLFLFILWRVQSSLASLSVGFIGLYLDQLRHMEAFRFVFSFFLQRSKRNRRFAKKTVCIKKTVGNLSF